jgi:hypothetical protein
MVLFVSDQNFLAGVATVCYFVCLFVTELKYETPSDQTGAALLRSGAAFAVRAERSGKGPDSCR